MNRLTLAVMTSAILALTLTPLMRALAIRRGYLDVPNERSSHVRPTPRTGGLAIFASFALASALAGGLGTWRTGAILAGALALIGLALADDLRPLPREARLILQIVILAGVVAILGWAGALTWPSPSFLAALVGLGALIWLLGLVNTYNFMDGLNGIAGLAAVVSGVTLAVLALRRGDVEAAILAASLAAATAGFLPFNLPSGSIFMGDTGSTTLGLVLGALVLCGAGPDHLPLPEALPFLPFVLDASITLIRRALRGERFFSTPHRSHFYQRLQQQGWSHTGVASLYAGLTGICALLALVFEHLSLTQRSLALTAIVAGHVVVFLRIQQRWSRLTARHAGVDPANRGTNP